MKRKFLVTAMAICMAGASVMPAVGCKNGDNKNAGTLTKAEFLAAMQLSFDNYAEKHSDYETFEDISFTVNLREKLEQDIEINYTPDGETEEKTVTYVAVDDKEMSLKVDIKRIDGDMFFDMETVCIENDVDYNQTENDEWMPIYNKEQTVQKLSCGVENGVYYMKAMVSYCFGETELGEPSVEKYYKTFDGVEEYQETWYDIMMEFNATYVDEMYLIFTTDFGFSTFDNFSKYYKDGNLTMVDTELALINTGGKEGYSDLMIAQMQYAYTENGFSYGDVKFAGEDRGKRMDDIYQIKLNLSSDFIPEANALNGYTLQEDLTYYDYFGYLSSNL